MVLVTLAELLIVPAELGRTTIVAVAEAPAATLPMVKETIPDEVVNVP